MADGESPTIARLRVRIAVREAREAAGLTQAQVAESLEWSHSKVIRIENGDNTISIQDLRGLLALLNIQDKKRVDALLADARIARKRQPEQSAWWKKSPFREEMSDPLRRFVEYEAEASEIRSFNIFYVPGPLQTSAYGAALTAMWKGDGEALSEESEGGGFTEKKVEALVDARRLRREAMQRRSGSLKYLVLFDQSVLMRPIGGASIFAAQLQQIVDLAGAGFTKVRMLPFDLPIAIANNGSYDLLQVGEDGSRSEVMYRESGPKDEMVENRPVTERHRHRFDQLWEAATAESDTINFIRTRIDSLAKPK
ncbi:helix-turn-helix transcriptional regulator [Actinoplanes sp. LDG1-06]|uniref:Helix-turn-helix transcriptional regulator n=1 Tax=Paractinoplanes ovalisporus TaxID=2810368 RepID=A0ABS2AE41_9ACTN|nr:helix-turn-helix transcriptional regulator [Actinoplanes ovalisporus]MBM2618035.1 helix-turn-helix transcriptional regulator [Actinoplanes ovalisporus]